MNVSMFMIIIHTIENSDQQTYIIQLLINEFHRTPFKKIILVHTLI